MFRDADAQQGSIAANQAKPASPKKKPSRRLRLWQKKRGSRQTGYKVLGGAGEAVFFAVLFLLGILALTELLVLRWFEDTRGLLTDGWGLWLCLLVLTSLVIGGAGGLIYSVVLAGTSAERRSALAKRATGIEFVPDTHPPARDFPNVPRDTDWKNSPGVRLAYRLPITSSPAWRTMVVAMFCLIWNGAVAVLLILAVNQRGIGGPEWRLVILVLVFASFGVLALVYLFRLLLLATAIGPTVVEISDQPLFPGLDCQVHVTQTGHLSFDWIELSLVCDEEVTYAQGTDTRTETRRVYEKQVFRRNDLEVAPGAPFEHGCELQVPLDGMHSFLSDHNLIQWKLIVRASPTQWSGQEKATPRLGRRLTAIRLWVTQWPEYERTFPVVVYPGRSVVMANDRLVHDKP